jgi:hypothetical protein
MVAVDIEPDIVPEPIIEVSMVVGAIIVDDISDIIVSDDITVSAIMVSVVMVSGIVIVGVIMSMDVDCTDDGRTKAPLPAAASALRVETIMMTLRMLDFNLNEFSVVKS